MFIKKFSEISYQDLPQVGGKNAALGEMINNLPNIPFPNGFVVTVAAYWNFLQENNLTNRIQETLKEFHLKKLNLEQTSQRIRSIIESGTIPQQLRNEIITNYKTLCDNNKCSVAVRSSATAEDLPTASFAGQQESFLHITNEQDLLIAYKKCLSSLFTPRAIMYRREHNFDDMAVGLSVGIQQMIRSDLACSGVAFTIDTESGFKDVVFINSSWGLGEAIVQGAVSPDSFFLHKPTLKQGFKPILKKELGSKKIKIIYDNESTKEVPTSTKEQQTFSLNDQEILHLASMSLEIEQYFSTKNGTWTPMDIEWAKDGVENKIYIVQARPETVYAHHANNLAQQYVLTSNQHPTVLLTGKSIGKKIASGTVKVIDSPQRINEINAGDILVTTMTNPDWVPVMKKAAAIITDEGGRTCHAAIVSRELGIPAIVATGNGTTVLKNGQRVTVDCSQGEHGYIYEGNVDFTIKELSLSKKHRLKTQLLLNIADPDQAFTLAQLPVDGVGLARLEFIISNIIRIHPMALLHPEKIDDKKVQQLIEDSTRYYASKQDFFVDVLAEQAGTIAAAFYPRPVIIRLSDFKSNEYRNLIGGSFFEPQEENPMLGLRGASRYYNPLYQDAFELECKAMKKIRDEMGLTNVKLMIPFVRTIEEAKKVIALLQQYGLTQGIHALELYMMCEIPSNVILIDQFAQLFDGFSIGSNDLTQMTLAVDRDSSNLFTLFDERNEAVTTMMTWAIQGAHKAHKKIGICGQAPSDYPEIAILLEKLNIDSISLNADAVIDYL